MFQVFIPNVFNFPDIAMETAGIEQLKAGAQWIQSDGPDGLSGSIAYYGSASPIRFGFQPTEQTWLPAVADRELSAGRYWIGFWNYGKITPGSLANRTQYRGKLTQLGDGQQWLIPDVKELPRTIVQTNDGLHLHLPESLRPFDTACDLWRQRIQQSIEAEQRGEPISFPYDEMFFHVVEALRLNYRVTTEVVGHLGMMTTENCVACVLATLGA